jgi:pimeloyl-ACP methyl ester carboxylesterase
VPRPSSLGETTGFLDNHLEAFAGRGAPELPSARGQGRVTCDGAQIWYASFGEGTAVILLHGGLGHSGNWGHQAGTFLDAGYRVIVIDSRGHGRSTLGSGELHYERMANDVLAVMDHLEIEKAVFVGWSDGACIAMVLAMHKPSRVLGVFYFACNMDPSGTKPFVMTEVIKRCLSRHRADYARLSPTPDDFDVLRAKLQPMQASEPNASATDLAAISIPVAIAHAENDEFITREHALHLARAIPGAELVWLPHVSHFAPLQNPDLFNAAVLEFLDRISSGTPFPGRSGASGSTQ